MERSLAVRDRYETDIRAGFQKKLDHGSVSAFRSPVKAGFIKKRILLIDVGSFGQFFAQEFQLAVPGKFVNWSEDIFRR